jgi:hypothetical protein
MHEKIRVWSKISQTWDVQKKDLSSFMKRFSFLIHGFIASRLLSMLLLIMLVYSRNIWRSSSDMAQRNLMVYSWLLRVTRHLVLWVIRLPRSLNIRVYCFSQCTKTVWERFGLNLWLLNWSLSHPLALGRWNGSKSTKADLCLQLWGKVWHLWLFFNIR